MLILYSVLTLIVVALRAVARRRRARLAPGPPAKPFIGNILDLPPSSAWLKLTEYQKTYGEVMYFHGLGNRILVLNSLRTISDLLDKRTHIYSDRPIFTVVGELMGLAQSMVFGPYNDEWREQRRLVHQALAPRAVTQYQTVHEDLAVLLCKDILERPAGFFSHVRLTASRLILAITYGLSPQKAEDEYISHAEETMFMVSEGTVPGAFLCDLIPAMKHLPSWLPFQKKARIGRAMIDKLVDRPFEHVQEEMRKGIAPPSLARELLSMHAEEGSSTIHSIKWGTGSLYGAGGETTYATVLSCILAMALHPEIMKKVHEELDHVIGADRLPNMNDRDQLPYLTAVIKETLRWHPPLPLSVARRTTEEDVYEGYTVPKDTVVLPNLWAIAYENVGPYDPYEFVPERFLVEDEKDMPIDPGTYVFGFARRLCPGRHLAEKSLFILLSTIFWTFDIQAPENGKPKVEFAGGLISYPEPFECSIVPRSQNKSAQVLWRTAQCIV